MEFLLNTIFKLPLDYEWSLSGYYCNGGANFDLSIRETLNSTSFRSQNGRSLSKHNLRTSPEPSRSYPRNRDRPNCSARRKVDYIRAGYDFKHSLPFFTCDHIDSFFCPPIFESKIDIVSQPNYSQEGPERPDTQALTDSGRDSGPSSQDKSSSCEDARASTVLETVCSPETARYLPPECDKESDFVIRHYKNYPEEFKWVTDYQEYLDNSFSSNATDTAEDLRDDFHVFFEDYISDLFMNPDNFPFERLINVCELMNESMDECLSETSESADLQF